MFAKIKTLEAYFITTRFVLSMTKMSLILYDAAILLLMTGFCQQSFQLLSSVDLNSLLFRRLI